MHSFINGGDICIVSLMEVKFARVSLMKAKFARVS